MASQELWALINFISDGQLLGHITTFHTEFERPILAVSRQPVHCSKYGLTGHIRVTVVTPTLPKSI